MADTFGIFRPGQPTGTPAASWHAPSRATGDGIQVCVDGQPRYQGGPSAGPDTPADCVLRAYRQHGDAVFGQLAGSFAAVIVDERRQQALLAVDRVGIRPLSYAQGAHGELVFGSSALTVAEAVAQSRSTPVRLDPQALYDYMYLHMVPSPATVYPGVRKVAPATCVSWSGGRFREERYWQPDFRSLDRRGDQQGLGEELHRVLRNAVERSLDGASAPGAFLSGGLDSSTVVGVLAQLSSTPARTFSVGFNTEGYDELSFARIAVARFGARGEEYVVTPADVASALPGIAGAYDEPFGNSSAIPTYFCARMAKRAGVDRLLAGDGGDEIFAGNPHYTRQALFEHYWRLPQAIRTGVSREARAQLDPGRCSLAPGQAPQLRAAGQHPAAEAHAFVELHVSRDARDTLHAGVPGSHRYRASGRRHGRHLGRGARCAGPGQAALLRLEVRAGR